MTSEGRAATSAIEMGLAREELRLVEVAIASGFERIAIARSYYAAFHAARACLYRANFEPITHAGVLQLFHLQFVRTGRFDADTAQALGKLQKFREEADYASSFVADPERAQEAVEAARRFVTRAEVLLAELSSET